VSDVLEVNLAALGRSDEPPTVEEPPPPLWRRRWARLSAGAVVLALVGGAMWWQRAVTSDPGLSFHARGVYPAESVGTGDQTGITENRNLLGSEISIAFSPGRRIVADWALHNGGARDVRIEAVPRAGFYYWGYDVMEVFPARGLDGAGETTAEPFRPFTLKAGETRDVRLHFRLADCDPAELQSGFSSIDALEVRYGILGLERAVRVPLDEFVLAVSTIGRCDRPIIDRS
jgi:hypothetical protein